METRRDKLIFSDSVKWKDEVHVSQQGSRVHTLQHSM